ncbi:MAG: glycosyl transferase [Bacteroidetes bacterium]|nr:MAG: glycosyl transferase [Bacteroidota bacterium]
MITKIIHYCWLSGEEYPQDVKNNIASWKAILPDYKFMLWDLKKSEILKSVWIQQALENKKYAFASDFIRLYAVYTYGGIYLDSDVEVLKSFDDLLSLPYFIGTECNTKRIEAAVFGSEKKTKWLLTSMEYYNNRCFVKEDGNFDMKILPRIMKSRIELITNITIMEASKVQESLPLLENEDSFFLFPFEYFSAKNTETGKITKTKNTYTIHHFSSSWMPFASKLRRKIIAVIGIDLTDQIISFMKLRELRISLKTLSPKYGRK